MRTFTFLMAAAAIIPCAYAEGSGESGWYAGLSYERLPFLISVSFSHFKSPHGRRLDLILRAR